MLDFNALFDIVVFTLFRFYKMYFTSSSLYGKLDQGVTYLSHNNKMYFCEYCTFGIIQKYFFIFLYF